VKFCEIAVEYIGLLGSYLAAVIAVVLGSVFLLRNEDERML